jgi:putative ABC transport system permease protein
LKEGASTGGRARTRLRDGLVIVQLGLSLGLVASAALLGRSVVNAAFAEPGFEPAGQVAGYVDLASSGRYDVEGSESFFRTLIERAEATPGVRLATLASQVPIAGGHGRSSVRPLGRDSVFFEAEYTVVGPRYFETLSIPMVRGRTLRGFDDEPEPVVVVNQALVSMFWPGEDPIGQELRGQGAVWRVVGVSGDVQMRSLRSRANPAVYYPVAQQAQQQMYVHLAAEQGANITPQTVRQIVAAIDPELPVSGVIDMEQAMTDSMGETLTIGYLVGAFALLALTLAVVGLYGLVSYGASQRVREVGIRMALGARPESLVRLILARGLAIATLGILCGIVVAYGLGTALQGLLFGVGHTDVATLAGAAALLLAAAALAAWLPARRVSRVDAAISLRD